MSSRLTLLAGPDALRLLRERGLHVEDVDAIPGASGGPKWIALHGVDRFLAGFLATRRRPLPLIGSSIGAWRLAALAQRDPLGAMERFREAYLAQRYATRPSAAHVSEVSAGILDALLGPRGAEEILGHPWARLHVVTARARGLLASEQPRLQATGLALAAAANVVARRTLGLSLERVVFHAAGAEAPFAGWRDLPTRSVPLDAENLRPALLASGSIPLVLSGVRFPHGPEGVFRDGGVSDYHLDVDFPPGDGLVLYPHFHPRVVPGWFDKTLAWRRAPASRLRRTLIVAPSPELVARLPGGRIPDRKDFSRMADGDRLRAWNTALAESEAMGEEFAELVATGRIAERVRPLA